MTPLVLLPGMMCDSRLFAPQIADLTRDRSVMVTPLVAHETVGALAEAVLAAAPPRFVLGGLSMGGIVSLEVERRAPDRTERLVLMDTTARPESEHAGQRRRAMIAAVEGGGLEEVMRRDLIPNYLAPEADRPGLVDLAVEMAIGLGAGVFAAQSRALLDRPDQTGNLARVTSPTLVLCGRHDALCPVGHHEEMAEAIPDAQLEIVDGAGHLPTLERPEETTARLRAFLDARADA